MVAKKASRHTFKVSQRTHLLKQNWSSREGVVSLKPSDAKPPISCVDPSFREAVLSLKASQGKGKGTPSCAFKESKPSLPSSALIPVLAKRREAVLSLKPSEAVHSLKGSEAVV